MKKFDYILIGTGQATGTILPSLLKNQAHIAVIESDKTGGTCVNWGCTPTKTLVASARDAHMVRRASDFGVEVQNFSIDFTKIMKRVNDIRNPSSEGFESWLKKVTTFYKGTASFVSDHLVEVNGEQLFGEKIIIHTGTRSRIPNIPGIETVPWLDNKGILSLDKLPEHLIVVGASYIGLEFAQAFKRLGTKVSIIGRGDRIVPREDTDISSIALNVLENEGLVFHLNTELKELEKSKSGVKVHFWGNEKMNILEGTHVLLAIGRVPNTDMLNLDSAGVEMDKRGFIKVNDTGQTSVPHIYALGDVNGKGAFTHTSVHDGQVFLEHLVSGPRRISHRIPIHSMFIDPPLARVGISESEALKSGKKILMGTKKMDTISRAKEKDEKQGLIKVLVDEETKLILGATIFGVGGDEIIGMLALAMQAGLPYTKLQETVLPHPTVSELIPWVFLDMKPLENVES